MPWRGLPHTADLCLGITAPDWPALAVGATGALAARLGEVDERAPAAPRRLRVTGPDREELLVRWLAELLYLSEVEKIAPRAVGFSTATDRELAGEVTFMPLTAPTGSIKAVTYHNLAVIAAADGWRVRIVFDV
jgi:SHS2 domain-containing protein